MEPIAIIEDAILERDGLYYNYKFHSSYRSETKSGLLKMIQDQLAQTRKQLTKTKVLFLTFGHCLGLSSQEQSNVSGQLSQATPEAL